MPRREPLFKPKALSEQGVAKLKPPTDRQYENHYDAIVPGLVLRVNSGGAKVWHVRYYVKGIDKHGKRGNFPRTHRLKRFPILKVKEAREAARAFLGDPQKALAKSDAGSFKEVAANFIKRHVDHKKLRSKKEIERCLNKYVYPRWGDRPFADLTRTDVNVLLDEIVDKHGPVQADMVLGIISSICTWYQSRNESYVSPIVKRMRRSNPVERRRTRILDDDEIRVFWEVASECRSFGALVKVLLLTGQRLRKVAHLRWDDISADGIWTVRTEPREKGNPGSLRLPPIALGIINAQPRLAGNPYVFVARNGGPMNSFTERKQDIDRKLKARIPTMKPWVLHDLRRSARSLMSRRELGVLPHIAEQVLGHKIPGVEGIYDRHGYDEDKTDALNKLATLIARIVNPPQDNVVAMTGRRKKRSTTHRNPAARG
jgi:integrase